MVPSTVATFLAFLLLVVPGLLFEFIRDTRRPTVQRSNFREVSSVLLAGTACSLVSIIILAALRGYWPASMPNPGGWLSNAAPYLSTHYRLIVRTVLLELALACLLSLLAARLSVRRPKGLRTSMSNDPTLWEGIFGKVEPSSNPYPYLTVRMANGQAICGKALGVDPHGSRDWGHLILQGALRRYSQAGAPEDVDGWQRVMIPIAEIQEIWIRFVSEGQ